MSKKTVKTSYVTEFLSKRTTITLEEYINLLQGIGRFVIPDYQRGYVWGQKPQNDYKYDSVTFLVHSLKEIYTKNKKLHENKYVFMQGITLHIDQNNYDLMLVDGQQRTTFFYLLLKYLGYKGYFKIHYKIRKASDDYLNDLDIENIQENNNEIYQDIFFFQKTIGIFREQLMDIDKDDFLRFVLLHVKFLVVCIPEEQAKVVFTMMNGNKAQMKEEELIKSELLRCASLKHDIIKEAEHAMVRSRLAREWDAWLHWWNKKEVIDFFHTDGIQLGWLLPLTLQKAEVSFEDFRDSLLNDKSIQRSKAIFKRMRLLQKRIEDTYNTSQQYNYIGAIMYMKKSDSNAIFRFLQWFFNIEKDDSHPKSLEELKHYYDWTILGVNHENISNNNIEVYNLKRNEFRDSLEDNQLYISSYNIAIRWLLLQNIKQDNGFKDRRFDFSIINAQSSLEHIYPKSKIGHLSESGEPLDWAGNHLDDINSIKLWRESIKWVNPTGEITYGSEHCIGNLVLLYKRDNSKFNDADFNRKNDLFFNFNDYKENDDILKYEAFKSRHLIHTTMIFSKGQWRDNNCWNPEQIARRKYEELIDFDKYYPVK